MGVLYTCLSAYHLHAELTKVRRGHWIPGAGIRDSFKLPYGCWELNLRTLEELQELLTAAISPAQSKMLPTT